MSKIIGILGGMGPAATVDIFNKFVNAINAKKDQDHIPLLISSIPDIPDRTQALLHNGESPLPYMQSYVHKLEDAGAECIVIACNTAHYWFSELKSACRVEMLSIIDSTVNEVVSSGKKKVGLLATNATLTMELYQSSIEAHGICCLVPDNTEQQDVMSSIYQLKSGSIKEAEELMLKQVNRFKNDGVEAIILGCTEIPVILANEVSQFSEFYFDSTAALVRASVKWHQMAVGKI